MLKIVYMKFSQRYTTKEFAAINQDMGLLEGVHIMEVGEAKGHDILIDSTTLMQIVELGNSQPQGVKCRFGHPNICAEALGTYLGRFKNFRFKDVNTVIADLYLDETAKNTPNGDLYSYVLTMAMTNPDMFGNSVVVKAAEPHMVIVVNDEGEEEPMEVLRVESLIASDLVDEPAATSKLFDTNSFAALVTEFLDSNPQVFEIMNNNPDTVKQFMRKYNDYRKSLNKSNKMEKSLLDKFKGLFKSDEDVQTFQADLTKEVEMFKAENETLKSEIEQLRADLESLKANENNIESLQVEFNNVKEEVETLKAENQSLSIALQTANEDLECFQTTHEPQKRTQSFTTERKELSRADEVKAAFEEKCKTKTKK